MNCEIKTEETANERELDCRQGLTDSWNPALHRSRGVKSQDSRAGVKNLRFVYIRVHSRFSLRSCPFMV